MKTFRFVVAILVAGLAGQSLLAAVLTQDPPISSSTKNAASLSGSDEAQVAAAIKTEVGKLSADDLAGQSLAREWLINEAQLVEGGSVSPAYADVYTRNLNDAFGAALKGAASVPLRINIGVITNSVTAKTKSGNLRDVIVTLLGDKSDALVYYGIKAGGAAILPVYSSVVIVPVKKQELLDAIVKAASSHTAEPLGGIIAEQAMIALNPSYQSTDPIPPEVAKPCAAAVIALLSQRVEQYKTGIPENPPADLRGIIPLLSNTTIWRPEAGVLTDKQRVQAVQLANDLIDLAAHRLSGNSTTTDEELIPTIKDTAEALSRLNEFQWSDAALRELLKGLHDDSMPGVLPSLVQDAADRLTPALQNAAPSLKDIQPAPRIAAPTTKP